MFHPLPATTVFEAKARNRRDTVVLFAVLVVLYVLFFNLIALTLFGDLGRLLLSLQGRGFSFGQMAGWVSAVAVAVAFVHFLIARSKTLDSVLDILGAKSADPRDRYHQVFTNLVAEAESATGIRPIRPVVIPTPGCNAFAVADGKGRAALGVTEGLLTRLERNELSAGVAHELRNGLATLGGYLELLAEESDPAASADYRRELERETAHLARVVDDFLAFARPGRARVEPADLGALLTALAAEPTVQDLGVTLRLPATPPPPLPADRPLLVRALGNLLRNAAEAQRASGRREPLEIELAAGEGEWEVRIGDRGAGVPEEVRTRLFQPFVSGRPGGTGLGLALAQRLVALHGGAVRLEPRAGGGTHAVVAFPVGAFVTERLDPERAEAPESLRREEINPLS